MANEHLNVSLKTSRIEALSDGIFAVAMTILIISFDILLSPNKRISEAGLIEALLNLCPDLLHYVEGFIILGAFWIEHHYQFHFIQRTNSTLLFINIIGLMFIVLIPFSTCVAGDYSNTRVAAWLLEINLLIAGLVFYLHWLYATAGHRLVANDLNRHIIVFYARRNLVVPLVSLAALIVSGIQPRWGPALYLLVPFILTFYSFKGHGHRTPAYNVIPGGI
ncbi:MAG: TMEM175 family protein [Kiritimatiellae bacterium]|nr:TMEM175 family protein [Kiritimatiellia bacterium]